MLADVLVIPELGQVALPRVAQYGHERVARAELACRTDGRDAIERARAADEDAFFAEQEPRHLDDLLVGDLEGVVDARASKVLRDAVDAHALGDGVVSVEVGDRQQVNGKCSGAQEAHLCRRTLDSACWEA